MVAPLVLASGLGLQYVLLYLNKRCIKRRKTKLHSHGPALVGALMVLMYFLFLNLTRNALEIFNCNPTDPPDGYTYLSVVFEKCGEPGGVHATLLPWAILAFIGYSLGYPAYVAWVLVSNRMKVMEDQLLRAHGLGDQRADNPHCYSFRKRYKKLYQYFRPDKWYE